ncbi:MAG: FAD-dependent oxidoreductase [Myxococcales bacterium]|nr:FAD-dependent oxidoreductase [Myxococcales bacterium]
MNVGIIGGGYAGRMAAARLALAGHQITLVDPFDHWVERTRLHQAAATGTRVEHPHRRLLDAIGGHFHRGRVVGIEGGELHLDGGATRSFDRMVIAAGSVMRRDTEGVREHALSLGDVAEATAIRERIRSLDDGAHVIVVGAGATGLELATEIAEAHPQLRVTLLGDPATALSPAGAQVVTAALDALGIGTRHARVHRVHDWGVDTDQGALQADLVLWAAGMRAPDWMRAAGLPVDEHGQLRVDPTLRVQGRPHLVAAGDCAATGVRMSCATAMPLGAHAAETLIREDAGQQPRPFRFAFQLRCVSLGRRRALTQLVHADDTPRSRAFRGRLATWIKEAILWGTVHMARWETKSGRPLYRWPQAPIHTGATTARYESPRKAS